MNNDVKANVGPEPTEPTESTEPIDPTISVPTPALQPPVASTPEPASDLPTTVGLPPDTPFYTVGQWAGITQYCCRFCPFDALELESIKEHMTGRHPDQVARLGPPVMIYDVRGRPVRQIGGL